VHEHKCGKYEFSNYEIRYIERDLSYTKIEMRISILDVMEENREVAK
jgi:hypothetical protein